MELIQLLLKEMDQESKTTRKMLERIPDDKYDYKPHEKSMPIKQLAVHIAELPTWVTMALTTDEMDFSVNDYVPKEITNTKDLLIHFEESLKNGKEHLEKADINDFEKIWTLRNGDTIYSQTTKYEVIRMAYSQIVHHRAQLGVNLRLLDIPIPGSYGPSADESSFG